MHEKAHENQTSVTPRVSSFFIENLLRSGKKEDSARTPRKDEVAEDVRRQSVLHTRETHHFGEVSGQATSTGSTVDAQSRLEWYQPSSLHCDSRECSESKCSSLY